MRYVRPCPLMPSVTMGIDAAVTANTNSSNTATREINAAPNFFRVQVFGALKIRAGKTLAGNTSASASFVVFPPASHMAAGGPSRMSFQIARVTPGRGLRLR